MVQSPQKSAAAAAAAVGSAAYIDYHTHRALKAQYNEAMRALRSTAASTQHSLHQRAAAQYGAAISPTKGCGDGERERRDGGGGYERTILVSSPPPLAPGLVAAYNVRHDPLRLAADGDGDRRRARDGADAEWAADDGDCLVGVRERAPIAHTSPRKAYHDVANEDSINRGRQRRSPQRYRHEYRDAIAGDWAIENVGQQQQRRSPSPRLPQHHHYDGPHRDDHQAHREQQHRTVAVIRPADHITVKAKPSWNKSTVIGSPRSILDSATLDALVSSVHNNTVHSSAVLSSGAAVANAMGLRGDMGRVGMGRYGAASPQKESAASPRRGAAQRTAPILPSTPTVGGLNGYGHGAVAPIPLTHRHVLSLSPQRRRALQDELAQREGEERQRQWEGARSGGAQQGESSSSRRFNFVPSSPQKLQKRTHVAAFDADNHDGGRVWSGATSAAAHPPSVGYASSTTATAEGASAAAAAPTRGGGGGGAAANEGRRAMLAAQREATLAAVSQSAFKSRLAAHRVPSPAKRKGPDGGGGVPASSPRYQASTPQRSGQRPLTVISPSRAKANVAGATATRGGGGGQPQAKSSAKPSSPLRATATSSRHITEWVTAHVESLSDPAIMADPHPPHPPEESTPCASRDPTESPSRQRRYERQRDDCNAPRNLDDHERRNHSALDVSHRASNHSLTQHQQQQRSYSHLSQSTVTATDHYHQQQGPITHHLNNTSAMSGPVAVGSAGGGADDVAALTALIARIAAENELLAAEADVFRRAQMETLSSAPLLPRGGGGGGGGSVAQQINHTINDTSAHYEEEVYQHEGHHHHHRDVHDHHRLHHHDGGHSGDAPPSSTNTINTPIAVYARHSLAHTEARLKATMAEIEQMEQLNATLRRIVAEAPIAAARQQQQRAAEGEV